MTQRVSQFAVEVLRKPTTAKARASQVAVEILRKPTTVKARTGQLAVEILRQNASTSKQAQSSIIVIAG